MSRNKNNKAKQHLKKLQANLAKQKDFKDQHMAEPRRLRNAHQRYIARLELDRGIRSDESLLACLPCITQADIDDIRNNDLSLEDLRDHT